VDFQEETAFADLRLGYSDRDESLSKCGRERHDQLGQPRGARADVLNWAHAQQLNTNTFDVLSLYVACRIQPLRPLNGLLPKTA
jgi:hypothetical protein